MCLSRNGVNEKNLLFQKTSIGHLLRNKLPRKTFSIENSVKSGGLTKQMAF